MISFYSSYHHDTIFNANLVQGIIEARLLTFVEIERNSQAHKAITIEL